MNEPVLFGRLRVCPPLVRDRKGTEHAASDLGFSVKETLTELGEDLCLLRRVFINTGREEQTVQLIFDAEAMYSPTRFTVPAVSYNGNLRSDGKEPHGWEKNGSLWYHSADRTSIPACTVFENSDAVTAVFASPAERENLFCSAAAIFANDDKRHRILWPDCNMPEAYTDHDVMTEKEERFLTIGAGESKITEVYLFSGTPKWTNYGMATLIDRLVSLFPFEHTAYPDVDTACRAAYAYMEAVRCTLPDGTEMFGNALRDRPDGDGQYMPYEVYEAGWSGQCISTARHYLAAWRRGEDPDGERLRIGLSCLDAWCSKQRENGLLQINFAREISQKYLPADTCNLGWAAHEMLLAWKLLDGTEHARPQYRVYAERLLDFFCTHYDPEDGFGMRWNMDGTKATAGGSAGGFVVMALCLGARLLGREDYLACAERADRFYFVRDLDDFVVTAGALDCRCIDKEGAYPFVTASLDLYELTGNRTYLEMAEKAAYYFTSWMFFYDVPYPTEVEFDRVGYYTAGGTGVSTQHPVIDPWGVLLVPELVRLGRITGNKMWRDIAYRMWSNAILCINLDPSMLWHGHHRPWGMQSEAFFQSSWSRKIYGFKPGERGRLNDMYAMWTSSFRLMAVERVRALEGDLHFFERK